MEGVVGERVTRAVRRQLARIGSGRSSATALGGTWTKSTTATGNGAGRLARENVERLWGILRSTPKSRSYPVLGAVLAFGTPAGLLLTTALAAGRVPTFAWAREEIARLPVTYAYLTLSTVAALAVFGYLVVRLFDRMLL